MQQLKEQATAKAYLNSGKQLTKEGKLNQAIKKYQQALQLKPDFVPALNHLAKIYESRQEFDQVITCLQRIMQLQPDNGTVSARLKKAILGQQNIQKAKANRQKAQPLHSFLKEQEKGKIYLRIWQALNQVNFKDLEEESSQYPTDIDQEAVKQYFQQTSQYKIINLTSLSVEDKSFITTSGLSLDCLNQNQKLISVEKVEAEKPPVEEHLLLQQLAGRDGYLSAVCPSTGQILQSNRSILGTPFLFYYRFVGDEVFYLVVRRYSFQKEFIYFPGRELIVNLKPDEQLVSSAKSEFRNLGIIPLKVFSVSYWNNLHQYLSNVEPVEKSAVVGIFSIFHHLNNELSGIQKMYESGLLDKIDKFWVIGPEYYGGIEEIFPEIPSNKVYRFNDWQTGGSSWRKKNSFFAAAANELIKNNSFALKLGDEQVSDELRDRVLQVSRSKCSSNLLAEVAAAKQKHSLLLWVSIRTQARTWVSQIAGIANIVTSLADDFPNLAVVFDGYTRIDIGGKIVNAKDEEIIQGEKEVVTQIQALCPQNIQVYDIIGSRMYEVAMWANAVDFCLVPAGSSTTKVRYLVHKPGFIHGNQRIPGSLSPDAIVNVPQENERGLIDYSYDFDWKIAYKKLLKIALSIKSTR